MVEEGDGGVDCDTEEQTFAGLECRRIFEECHPAYLGYRTIKLVLHGNNYALTYLNLATNVADSNRI